jgi:hypothetical protein
MHHEKQKPLHHVRKAIDVCSHKNGGKIPIVSSHHVIHHHSFNQSPIHPYNIIISHDINHHNDCGPN